MVIDRPGPLIAHSWRLHATLLHQCHRSFSFSFRRHLVPHVVVHELIHEYCPCMWLAMELMIVRENSFRMPSIKYVMTGPRSSDGKPCNLKKAH